MTRLLSLAKAVVGAAALTLALALPALAADGVIRIGYQKYGSLLLLKERDTLEKSLQKLGFHAEWTEFPGGPQLLEALNAGAIDFGTTGEAPPVFAQAAGAPLLYVAVEPPAPTAEAILVPKDSPITELSQLKGKRVALNKGSNVHYLLVKALEKAGLSVRDIEPVYLTPSDARAAFEQGAVDAWAIWDPYYAAAQAATQARTLADGTGLVANAQFLLASQDFTAKHGDVVDATLAALYEVEGWAVKNPDAVAQELSPKVGIPVDVLTVAIKRLTYDIHPLTDNDIAAQQKIADTFFELGLIPKKLTVADVVRKAKS